MDRVFSITTAIGAELELQANYLSGQQVTSIYFGGGTPSLVPQAQLDGLLQVMARHYAIANPVEITLEANPDDLSINRLKELRTAGINRLSIGLQSFNDSFLTYMNRAHSAEEGLESVTKARSSGFDNISIDIIFGLPGQTMEQLDADLDQATSLDPEHISVYGLTIEDKTVFGKLATQGKLQVPDEDDAAKQYERLVSKLTSEGYEHYEISNFSKPGFLSRHNTSYWRGEHYLGVGPSAHSFNEVSRQSNVANNSHYLKAITAGNVPFTSETLSHEQKVQEYILTTLRTRWGMDLRFLKEQLQYDLQQLRATTVANLVKENLVDVTGSNLKLTSQGKLLADKIALDLLP